MNIHVDAAAFAYFKVKPLSPNIGAELSGIKLSGDLPDEAIAEVRQALLDNKVVFFRDQNHLTAEEHIAFAPLRRAGNPSCDTEGPA